MKTLIFFPFVLLSSLLLAQSFNFNKLVKTELKGKKGILISDSFYLVNSDNDRYFLEIINGNTAELQVDESGYKHILNYKKFPNDGIQITYLYSIENETIFYNRKVELENWDFRVEKINDKEFYLGKYKSNKSKTPKLGLKVFLQESDKEALNYLQHIQPFFKEKLKNQLDTDKKYKIYKITFFPDGKEAKSLELVSEVDCNVRVEIPEKLIIKSGDSEL